MITTVEAKMSVTENLVEAVSNAREIVASRSEALRKGSYSLLERVVLFGEVNPLKKDVNKVRDVLAEEIKSEVLSLCEEDPASKRLTLKDSQEGLLSQNGKGAIFLRHESTVLELRPSMAETLDTEAATVLLAEKKLLGAVQTERLVVTDAEALREAVDGVLCFLDDHPDFPGARLAFDHLSRAWEGSTQTTRALSEDKMKELIQEGRLSVDEVVPLYQTRYSYKLYDK